MRNGHCEDEEECHRLKKRFISVYPLDILVRLCARMISVDCGDDSFQNTNFVPNQLSLLICSFFCNTFISVRRNDSLLAFFRDLAYGYRNVVCIIFGGKKDSYYYKPEKLTIFQRHLNPKILHYHRFNVFFNIFIDFVFLLNTLCAHPQPHVMPNWKFARKMAY